jgi:adenylate cyclase
VTIDARVLIADDDPLNRELLATALKNEGCEVMTAEDGLRALRFLRSDPAAFDLLLLDVMMPGLDGYDVLRHLRGETELARMPVIVVSAIDDIASVVKCLELGADDYLTKPFDPVLLRARINSSLTRKRQADTERLFLQLLEQEEERADRLILNVLPRPIADRLKRGDSVIADHFDDVTVMFADLVGFTALAAKKPAADVVALLDNVFTRFDHLTFSYGLEKIKTIGDAYLAAGGLTDSAAGHLIKAIEMAFDMLDTVSMLEEPMEIRIGIHAGPVVAGVIGAHKFSYDLWGDTVNVAARMESHGVPGRIHVSGAVRDRLSDRFTFEDRGLLELKNRGTMKTFLVRERPRQSERAMTVDLRNEHWLSREDLIQRR